MTKHVTGTRTEWLAARTKLLEAEKELMRRSDEVARWRQELPWVRIHTYSTYARGTESLMGTYRFLDLAPLGRNEEDLEQIWWRRHDEYERAKNS